MKTVNTTESTAHWTGKKFGGSHNGSIHLKSGSLEFDGERLTGGEFVIDMQSISVSDLSGESKEKLEGHLKSDDFFATDAHPTASLVFTEVTQKEGHASVTADLTVKGITHPISFDLKLDNNSASTLLNIDRSKYDVKYGSKSFFKGLGDNFIYDNFEVEVNLVY
ncbi:YceI family protein [Nonlabens xiamenensis]|uniref:YceI family protein n=1 Tax=Nonlabens xiamenensis TaxID=2341043 RepID=UPI000F6082F7|nr:YceI family protein [Nonlabens xiamenensis]